MKELHELKDMLCEELKEYGKKGDLTAGSLEVVDKLTHTIKNLDKIIEKYEDEEYSGMYWPYAYEGGSYRGGSYTRGDRGGSYARRRDSMGRYSREGGYSRHGDMVMELQKLMQDAPDEKTRVEFQKFIDKMERIM